MTLFKEPIYKGGYSGLPHIGHGQHIGHLAEYGEATLNEVKNLVRNAKWICRKYGRAANNMENVVNQSFRLMTHTNDPQLYGSWHPS